jgi:hypothetical protein
MNSNHVAEVVYRVNTIEASHGEKFEDGKDFEGESISNGINGNILSHVFEL